MSKTVFCWHCNGKGRVRHLLVFSKWCPICDGHGTVQIVEPAVPFNPQLPPHLARLLKTPSLTTTQPPVKPKPVIPPPYLQPGNPQNPNSPLHRRHPFNPNNPNSILNPNNPMNPNSLRNPNNPMNPNSPRNPNHPMNPHNPHRR